MGCSETSIAKVALDFPTGLAVGQLFEFGQHPCCAGINLMAIRLADAEDRRQIYQGRIVAKVIKCQQQAVF